MTGPPPFCGSRLSLRCVCRAPRTLVHVCVGRCIPRACVCLRYVRAQLCRMNHRIGDGNTCYCWSSGLAGTGFQFPLLDSSAPFLGRLLSLILSLSVRECQLCAGDWLGPTDRKIGKLSPLPTPQNCPVYCKKIAMIRKCHGEEREEQKVLWS